MPISNYGELKSAVAAWSDYDTLAAQIPDFIQIAQDALNRRLRVQDMVALADLTIDAERVAVPEGFLAVERLYLDGDDGYPLAPVSAEHRMIDRSCQGTGRPRFYAEEGGYLTFSPRPDAAYAGKLGYYKRLSAFAADGDADFILANHRAAYLYGALAELNAYAGDVEEEAKFRALFEREIALIEQADLSDRMAGGAARPYQGQVA